MPQLKNPGLALLFAVIAAAGACTSAPTADSRPVGAFLDEAQRPDLVTLLPVPPGEDSEAAAADREASKQALRLADTERWEAAILDASMRAPGGAAVFSCAAVVARLHGSAEFRGQIDAARRELDGTGHRALGCAQDCIDR